MLVALQLLSWYFYGISVAHCTSDSAAPENLLLNAAKYTTPPTYDEILPAISGVNVLHAKYNTLNITNNSYLLLEGTFAKYDIPYSYYEQANAISGAKVLHAKYPQTWHPITTKSATPIPPVDLNFSPLDKVISIYANVETLLNNAPKGASLIDIILQALPPIENNPIFIKSNPNNPSEDTLGEKIILAFYDYSTKNPNNFKRIVACATIFKEYMDCAYNGLGTAEAQETIAEISVKVYREKFKVMTQLFETFPMDIDKSFNAIASAELIIQNFYSTLPEAGFYRTIKQVAIAAMPSVESSSIFSMPIDFQNPFCNFNRTQVQFFEFARLNPDKTDEILDLLVTYQLYGATFSQLENNATTENILRVLDGIDNQIFQTSREKMLLDIDTYILTRNLQYNK